MERIVLPRSARTDAVMPDPVASEFPALAPDGHPIDPLRLVERLDELSADNVAMELVGVRKTAARALALLTVGPSVLRYIDFDVLEMQARAVAANRKTNKAERSLTHPLMLRRLIRMLPAATPDR